MKTLTSDMITSLFLTKCGFLIALYSKPNAMQMIVLKVNSTWKGVGE